MKPFFFALLAVLFLSSCVAVRFPEEIEIKIEMPENASPEQIQAVMGSLRLEMNRDQGRRVKVVVDSIPSS
jgi:flagellar basal body P-ring protein FlgI